jgi:hypothetical protein
MNKPVTLSRSEEAKARLTPTVKAFGVASPERIAEIESGRSALAAMTPEQRVDLALKRKQETIENRKSPRFGYIEKSYAKAMSENPSEGRSKFLDWLKGKGVSEEDYYSNQELIKEFRQFLQYDN